MLWQNFSLDIPLPFLNKGFLVRACNLASIQTWIGNRPECRIQRDQHTCRIGYLKCKRLEKWLPYSYFSNMWIKTFEIGIDTTTLCHFLFKTKLRNNQQGCREWKLTDWEQCLLTLNLRTPPPPPKFFLYINKHNRPIGHITHLRSKFLAI